MEEIEIKAWVPVQPLLRFDEWIPSDFDDSLEIFREFLTISLPSLLPNIVDASITIENPPEKILDDIRVLNDWWVSSPFKYLRIKTIFRYDLKKIQDKNPDSKIDINDFPGMAACILPSGIIDSFILAEIALPGRLRARKGRTYSLDRPMNAISSVHSLGTEACFSPQLTWPKLRSIDIYKVLKWQSRLGLFESGIANSPVQRAFAAFTHLLGLSINKTGEQLFWAMQGLEAFYCRGTGDLRRQLNEKTSAFLGHWNDKKNLVGHLYDLRSKFVHGDFPIERWNNDLEPNKSQFIELCKFSDARDLAVRILLATLQKCVEENIVDISFDIVIKTE